jgi:hypothetical protein
MSQDNVDRAKRAYAAMNDAYRTGDFGRVIAEFFDRQNPGRLKDDLGVRLDVYAHLDDALEAAGGAE